MDHEQTMGVTSRVLDQKQQNIFGRISLFWSVELQVTPNTHGFDVRGVTVIAISVALKLGTSLHRKTADTG